MFALSMLAQLVAVACGIFLMVTDGFLKGLALIVMVAVAHFAFAALTNGLLYLHQRTMSQSDLENLAHFSRIGLGSAVTPRAWNVIATICGILFVLSVGAIIYWFLTS